MEVGVTEKKKRAKILILSAEPKTIDNLIRGTGTLPDVEIVGHDRNSGYASLSIKRSKGGYRSLETIYDNYIKDDKIKEKLDEWKEKYE